MRKGAPLRLEIGNGSGASEPQYRPVYESNSLSSRKPWDAEGISRATWYRRHETSVSATIVDRCGHTCLTPSRPIPAPHGPQEGESLSVSDNTKRPRQAESLSRPMPSNTPDTLVSRPSTPHTLVSITPSKEP